MTANDQFERAKPDPGGRNTGQAPLLPYLPHDASHRPLFLLAALVLSNGLLLAPAGGALRVTGAVISMALPGLAWSIWLWPRLSPLACWTMGGGLSYILALVLGLILHYLPGSVPLWAELVALDALALIPCSLVLQGRGELPPSPDGFRGLTQRETNLTPQPPSLPGKGESDSPPRVGEGLGEGSGRHYGLVVLILLVAAFFRFTSLGYSEFQGDEALAMITAAEALEGHQDALFLRGKGPGEVLLPMLLWRLTGTINEQVARLPFAIAGLLAVSTMYLLGQQLFAGVKIRQGWLAALLATGLFALNGFMIGFSRIVQYQALVIWLSSLALLCAWEYRASRGSCAARWSALSGVFLGAGLLAHYDAILVAPAIAYLLLSRPKLPLPDQQPNQPTNQLTNQLTNHHPRHLQSLISNLAIAAVCVLLVAGLFYLPYILDPQATRTGSYLGDRIGDALLKNNLSDFLHFNVFYSSFYYVILTGLLIVGYLAWVLRETPGVQHLPGGRYWVPGLAAIAMMGLAFHPELLRFDGLDLAAVPLSLILLGAFLSTGLDAGQRAIVAWLAVPFLGYNFAVALPLTHIYTVVPAWCLLTALAAARLWDFAQSHLSRQPITPSPQPPALSPQPSAPSPQLFLTACCLSLSVIFGGYLYTAYLRHDVELWQDWPDVRPALYWSPYPELPPAGFFGFPHRTGWKVVGALYAEGVLKGDYGSNEEPEVTTWYTRGAPRACDDRPEYYLIADDLVDPRSVNRENLETNYTAVGEIRLPNSKGLTIYQTRPATASLDPIQVDPLGQAYDRTARPVAFARSARGSQPSGARLGGLVRLIGYDVDAHRARPGGRLSVTLYWQAEKPMQEDYHIFVHLEGDETNGTPPDIWGQADGRPVCWTYPTFDWRPGQIIADQHAIRVKPDTPPGDYALLVGMYRPDTGARLDQLDETGRPIANFIKLTQVSIQK